MMDFNIVKKQIISAYLDLYDNEVMSTSWSLGDCINLFRYFYREYKTYLNKDHPQLSIESIMTIVENIGSVGDYTDYSDGYEYLSGDPEEDMDVIELFPDDYKLMIERYFEKDFNNGDCDYSIAHFMSGAIRYYLYREVCNCA